MSKVRRVLPGSRDDECDPPLCIDPNDPDAVAAAAAAGQDTGSGGGGAGSGSEQGSSFVEAVREAAAALDVAGAKEVGSRLAEKVRSRRGRYWGKRKRCCCGTVARVALTDLACFSYRLAFFPRVKISISKHPWEPAVTEGNVASNAWQFVRMRPAILDWALKGSCVSLTLNQKKGT